MTDTPWTPGPLTARGTRICANGSVDTFYGAVEACIGRAEYTEQHDTEGRVWKCGGSPEANARMWAAAPDMAEALERIIGLDSHIDASIRSSGPDRVVEYGALARIALAALAKARGQL